MLASVALLVAAGCAPPQVAAAAAEATFERTLAVNGSALQLSIATGSGSITLSRGSDKQVHIIGHVKAGWGASASQVHEVADNPPIEQTGDIVRIGRNRQHLRHISISYEIEAPASAFLHAATGSGNISDSGVGENTKLITGSGNIRATGLNGTFTITTGSGSIQAEQTGQGDVKATTGSGSIKLTGLHGGLKATTGSGGIKLTGTPTSQWVVRTGSGSIEFWSGDSAFELDASTGSGGIHSDRAMMTHGATNKHHVTGNIGGGGPRVRLSTGSGSIHIH